MKPRSRKPETDPPGDVSPAEAESLAALTPGHIVARPAAWRAGIVLASPHSGDVYPRAFRAASVLSETQLRCNEDVFVDQLVESGVAAGVPLIRARFPRCYVDANRAADELPRAWADGPVRDTARAQAGIGVIPTHVGERAPIYRRVPSRADAQARLHALYHPYHDDLRGLLDEATARFGHALLLDCHSMPGFAPMGSRRPDIVLGDRYGKSCEPQTLSTLRQRLQAEGFSVAVNYPYAGGFVTEHYGRPDDGVEAVQIEINRDLYLNPVTLAPKRGFEMLKTRLARVIRDVVKSRAPGTPDTLAAQ